MKAKQQSGFTLIELVMVIVILGILSAVAIPQFVNLQDEANAAAVQGVAGGLGSASAVNYAARSVSTTHGLPVDNCQDVGNLLQGGLPTGYSITAADIDPDETVDCTVSKGSNSADFPGIGID